MSIASAFDRLHAQAKSNSWLWLFSVFCRVSLAFGFFVAGMVKILGERFASGLSANHPMGHYLEALHQTGYYYTFVGIAQIAAAILLLFPRTVTLGAFLYFPIIFNICVLTYATRFDGSIFTAPLMTLANLYLLGWNYEKWKGILPFKEHATATKPRAESYLESQVIANWRAFFSLRAIGLLYAHFRAFLKELFSDRFPWRFAAGVFLSLVLFVLVVPRLYSIKPRNTEAQCLRQFNNTRRTQAGGEFCRCIHQNGESLDKCLDGYNQAADDNAP